MRRILLRYCIIIISLTGFIGCEGFLSFNPILENIEDGDIIGDDGDDDDGDDGNDGNDGNDNSTSNDPEISSCECRKSEPDDFSYIMDIPTDLPENVDLSELMPPVKSQGNQGSCTSWAIVYYLKSYQEKIQYGYDYENLKEVMSPAYIYNQVKVSDDCQSGSSIRVSLDKLKDEGVVSWIKFPYTDESCNEQPPDELIGEALENRIGSYYPLGVPDENTDENYTLMNLIKAQLNEGNPIVTSFIFNKLLWEYYGDEYIAYDYLEDPNVNNICHAILIVGYNDEIGAFKFVNSWGANWGNQGYGWLTYDYFLPENHELFVQGYMESYITYDID
ncbi:MAG: C1 family peptidase [Flavobacteriales bacterium]|nr:C1 family peptidase [Flavobacteriales bacterium]